MALLCIQTVARDGACRREPAVSDEHHRRMSYDKTSVIAELGPAFDEIPSAGDSVQAEQPADRDRQTDMRRLDPPRDRRAAGHELVADDILRSEQRKLGVARPTVDGQPLVIGVAELDRPATTDRVRWCGICPTDRADGVD